MSGMTTTQQDRQLIPAELHIRLLGLPQARWRGEMLEMPRRQVRALLYRLAADTRPVARDGLCFLFWPDAGDATARHNLSRLLAILRATLPDPNLLMAHDDQIALRRPCIWTDTQAFSDLHLAWSSHGDIASLRQAADLWRGPFLEGFSLPDSPEFDAWLSLEREHWTRLTLQILSALTDALAIERDYAGAIGYALRTLALDELAEDVHRRLIELYALNGKRSAALQQYERCVTVLERELGVDPMPETQAVYRAVLHDGTGGARSAASRPQDLWPVPRTPLIGRAAGLCALHEAYRQARAGHGSAFLVSGEPGVGKSRLMQEFAGRVRSQTLVLAGRCYPETRTTPYQPLVEALRPHLDTRRFEFEAGEQPPWLAALGQLFPELRPTRGDLAQAPAGEPGWARTRLFEALETLVLRLAQGAPAPVLILDDLHWADSASLDWLAFMGRRLHSRPLLVVGAYRTEEASTLNALRSGLARQGVLHELALEGLDEQAVGEIVRHLGGPIAVDRGLTGRLHQATGGNPFFLLEILAALSEAGDREEPAAGAPALPLPDSICQTVRLRVEQLSPTARQVLAAAAVLGPACCGDALHLTAGRTEMEIADALDELAGRQFLIQEVGLVRFRHEIVREVVSADLSAYRRRLLHQRAGEALELARSSDAAALARHFAGAALPGRAARYALQAGLAAKQVFAHAEARSHFDQALALLAQEAPALHEPAALGENRRLRIQALEERGWALRLLGDMAAYSRDLEEEAQLTNALDDRDMLARLRWRQASAHLWFCRYQQASAAAEEGLRLASTVGDDFMKAACLRALGLAARESGDDDLARRALEEALALFLRLDHLSYQVHTLGNLSTLACYQGDPERALGLAQQALAVCDAADLQADRRVPLGDIGAAAAALGEPELARRSLAESLAIARQVSDRTQEILCLGHLGWLDVQEGQAAPAVEHLRAALALAEQVDSCAEQAWLHAGLAEALRLAGDLASSTAHARRAVELAETTGQVHAQHLVLVHK